MSSRTTPVSFNFIGEGTEFRGDIDLEGDTHIYGKIIGNISGRAGVTLTIEYTGMIQGDITGVNVNIQGQLLGNIKQSQKVEASSTSVIKGTISSKSLQILPGAKILGNIHSIETSSN